MNDQSQLSQPGRELQIPREMEHLNFCVVQLEEQLSLLLTRIESAGLINIQPRNEEAKVPAGEKQFVPLAGMLNDFSSKIKKYLKEIKHTIENMEI